ncbi:MAG: hypothetical protein ACI83I_000426 [Bacteroidia bacterium]|jgi:hypothetical protein
MNLAQTNYKEILYLNNPEKGYFQKQPARVPFLKMPFELKIEPTQDERIKRNGAKEVLTSRKVKGKYKFISGMIPTRCSNFYMANDYEFVKNRKINSLIIIEISEDCSSIRIYYFNRFYIDNPTERERHVLQFIEHKKRENDPPFAQSNYKSSLTIQRQR